MPPCTRPPTRVEAPTRRADQAHVRPTALDPPPAARQVCFDSGPRDGAETTAAKDSLADLLYEISLATHDEEEGDAGEDDVGDGVTDDDDTGVDMLRTFRDAIAAANRSPNGDDEEEDDDYDEEDY